MVSAVHAVITMRLEGLNALDADSAARELLACCGSTEWASEMAGARPFDSLESMGEASDTVWASLARSDWLQAFAAHPRIGERSTAGWAAREQSGVGGAPNAVLDRLAAGNRTYEARFGYIFIVCATGKSAGEMLTILEQRLMNDPDEELHIAAEEQRKITRLRLARLLAPEAAKGLEAAPSAKGRETAGGGGGAPPQTRR